MHFRQYRAQSVRFFNQVNKTRMNIFVITNDKRQTLDYGDTFNQTKLYTNTEINYAVSYCLYKGTSYAVAMALFLSR